MSIYYALWVLDELIDLPKEVIRWEIFPHLLDYANTLTVHIGKDWIKKDKEVIGWICHNKRFKIGDWWFKNHCKLTIHKEKIKAYSDLKIYIPHLKDDSKKLLRNYISSNKPLQKNDYLPWCHYELEDIKIDQEKYYMAIVEPLFRELCKNNDLKGITWLSKNLFNYEFIHIIDTDEFDDMIKMGLEYGDLALIEYLIDLHHRYFGINSDFQLISENPNDEYGGLGNILNNPCEEVRRYAVTMLFGYLIHDNEIYVPTGYSI